MRLPIYYKVPRSEHYTFQEASMNTITFMSGLLTFYLKGEISTNQNLLKLKSPNTILAIIPLGSANATIPVDAVASADTDFKLNLKRFIVGVVICLLSFSLFSDSIIYGIVLLLWGASMVITSFVTRLSVTTTGSITYYLSFSIFEKSKAYQAQQLIENMSKGRLDDTNSRQVAEAQTNAIVDAIKSNKYKYATEL